MNTNTANINAELAIELTGLTKRFGSALAVDNLSLSVKRGSTFGLIGPNGAGKSTTIKMLMGLLSSTAGTAHVLGRNVVDDSVEIKQRVGYVPEQHFMDRWMRVAEVVGYCRSGFDHWNDDTCRDLLSRFELAPEKKVKQLSKGMLVKLSLVLAVSHEPEMLVLDEPMAGLDPMAREEFLDGVLRTVCDRGQTVLLSTHSLDDVQRIADTVGFLYSGRMIVQSNIDELLAKTKRIRATLTGGTPPDQLPSGVIWHQVEGRKWLVTVADFKPDTLQEIAAIDGVDNAETIDIGLEDLFKDFVKGQRSNS